MKHVLHFLDSLEISGGVQAVVMNTYRSIDRTRVQFDFAVYECPEKNSYRAEIENLGGTIHVIGGLGSCGLFNYIRNIQNVLKKRQYDIVHAHNLHHNGLILWQAEKAGVPIRISHCHQSADERNVSLPRRALAEIFKKLIYRYATCLVACSDKAADFLYGDRAYTFLPNAIDVMPYMRQYDLSTLRKSLGIEEKDIIILHVGRFCYPKNHGFDLALMNDLSKKGKYVLLLAGGGELEDELREKVKEHQLEQIIQFIGLRKDIPALLQLADVTILPSLAEGLPMVAVEAQAAGCPCILSDVITRQTDLGLGLVEFLPLDTELWSSKLQNVCTVSIDKIPYEMILQKLKETGFESVSNNQR